ncbi:MAG: hypothetical protein ABSD42_06220 [Candidatus Bathyarchaeia archaeon]|jgi:hypothetical protein
MQDQVMARYTAKDKGIVPMSRIMRAYSAKVHAERFEISVCRDRETKEIYLVVRVLV